MNITPGNLKFVLKSGALIPLLVMLPNIVWMILPKPAAVQQTAEPLALTIVENIGRIAILVVPFFYALDWKKPLSVPVLIAMGLALALYYAAWIRYFSGGMTAELFRAPLLGIPLPLALAPVAFLLLSSYLMGSWIMFGSALLFGVAHIWVSAITL